AELERVEPVLLDLAGAPVSIDTSKAAVARRALELGAELVNDVTALRGDAELAGVVADAGCYLCLMHMRGEPRTMQEQPVYDGVEEEEQRLGQLFLFDVELEVGERGTSDRLDEAVDYTAVAAAIRELSSERRFDLIEALAAAAAELLHERFAPERVRVRVR